MQIKEVKEKAGNVMKIIGAEQKIENLARKEGREKCWMKKKERGQLKKGERNLAPAPIK